MKSNKKVNTRELLRHTFDMMQLLKAKAIGVDEAKAQSNLVKQANNLLKYELDRAVSMKKYENLEIRNIEELE